MAIPLRALLLIVLGDFALLAGAFGLASVLHLGTPPAVVLLAIGVVLNAAGIIQVIRSRREIP